MKRCRTCRQWKPLDEFYLDRAQRRSDCKQCVRDLIAGRRRADPEHHAKIRKRTQLKTRYGVTPEEVESLASAQGNRCAICNRPEPGGSGTWHTDHDHTTGVVRGLLCASCNRKLGVIEDLSWVRKARRYLANPPAPRILARLRRVMGDQ